MAGGIRAGSLYYAVQFDRETIKSVREEAARTGKELSKALNEVSAQKAATEASKATAASSKAFDELKTKAQEHGAELRRLQNEQKAGTITQEQYRQKVEQLRKDMQATARETTRGSKAYDLLQASIGRITTGQTRDSINALNNEVFSSRNLLEHGAISADDFRKRMSEITTTAREMQAEMVRVNGKAAEQSQEYRRLSNAIGGAERANAALDGRMTKLGMSQQVHIGALQALRTHYGGLGPAGAAVVGTLGLVSGGFSHATKEAAQTNLTLKGVTRTMWNVVAVGPLFVAAFGGAALAGLSRFVSAAVDAAGELDTLRTQTGMTAEALQEYGYAAEQAGVDTDKFHSLMGSLQRRMGRAADGNERYATAFETLGVTIKDADGNLRSIEDILPELADGFAGITNETERARLATTVMNNAGAELLPLLAEGAESIDELRDRARELGIVLGEDSVDALVKYQAQVKEVQAQLGNVRNELSAALIPILADGVLPLVQDHLIPKFQELAGRVNDFMTTITDAGEAGDELRTKVAEWLAPFVRWYHAVASVGYVLKGLGQVALGAVGSVGAVIGDLSVQVATFAESIASIEQGLKWWQRGNILEAIEMFRTVGDIEWPDLRQTGEAAGAVFTEGLDDAMISWAQSADHATALESTTAESIARTIETLSGDRGEKAGDAFVHSFGSALDGAATDLGSNFSDDFGEGLDKNDPLTPVRLWTRRLAFELEQGLKTPISVLDVIRPRLEDLISERDRLFEAGDFGSEAWDELEEKIKIIETTMTAAAEALPGLVIGPRPDEGEHDPTVAERLAEEQAKRAARYAEIAEQAGVGSVAGVAEANTLALAQLEETLRAEEEALAAYHRARQAMTLQPDEGEPTSTFGKVYGQLKEDLRDVDLRARLFGETASTVQERIRLQEQAVLDLAREYGELSPEVQFAQGELEDLEQQLEELTSVTDDAADAFGEKLGSAIAGGLGWLVGHAQELGAAGQELNRLREQLQNVMGTAPDATERLRAGLQALVDDGGPAAVSAQELLDTLAGWEAAEPDRVLDEYAEAMNDAALKAELFGAEHELAGEQAELTADVIERLIPLLGAESDTVQDLTKRWRELREEQEKADDSTNHLAERLGQIGGTLQSIGGSGSGPLSDFVTGLGDAFSIAEEFASGDILGGVTSVISGIFSAVTSVIEANRKAREELAKTEASFKAVDISGSDFRTVERQKTGQFLFFPIYSDVTVNKDDMVAVAQSIEDAFMSGLDDAKDVALAGGSLEEIEAAIEEGLMNAVIDGFWEGFIQTEAIKEKFGDDLAEIAKLAAAGDTEGAMRLIQGMRSSIKDFSGDIAELLHGLGPTAAEQFEQAAESIADSIQAGLESGLARGVKAYLESGNLSDLEDGLYNGLHDAVTNSLVASLIESSLMQGALAGYLAEISQAFAAGDTETAAVIAEEMAKHVPQLAADIARIIEPFRNLPTGRDSKRTSGGTRGGGTQVSEITGPTRDLLLTTLAPLANLDFLPSILTKTYELLDARLPYLGVAPAYAGTTAGAGGVSVSIGDIHISSSVIPPGAGSRGLVTSLGDEFGRVLARELRGKGR